MAKLTKEDCKNILDAHKAPAHVKRHCLAVGDVAVNIARALKGAGFGQIDPDVVRAAGYLHDIARAGKDHDVVGAEIVRKYDEKAGDAVERHMRLNFPEIIEEIGDADVVALADRMVKEDRFVGYEARMDELLWRYADVPEVTERVRRNMGLALGLIGQIETRCGRSIREIAMGGRVDAEMLLPRVERPGRYIGGEMNAVSKEWESAALHFCFAFPDLYEIGMSYTGLQILYGMLNERADTVCERVFAPAADMDELLAAEGLPLFSLESRHAVKSFDMVGFTLQYELCYTNVLRMLRQAQIPLRASERGEGLPFVVGGGPCCANPEPLAEFFDLFCVGDGEDVLAALADLFARWKQGGRAAGRGRPRNETAAGTDADLRGCPGEGAGARVDFLREAARIPGVYVPGFYKAVYVPAETCVFSGFEKTEASAPDQVARAVVPDLDAAFFPERPVVAHIESVHDRAVVEIMRGCYRKCRFCQASYACEGVRRRSPERIRDLLKAQLANTGYDEASLLSLSTGDYPGIELLLAGLMDELAPMDVAVSLPSLRLDSLTSETLQRIGEYKNTSLTFAPEAGTQRMRDLIGKNITEADILRAIEIALPLGFTKFKFYFMIGLPSETEADLAGIADLARSVVRKAKAVAAERGEKHNFHLSVSVSNFVPKPGTPFERERGCEEAVLMEKIRFLKEEIRRAKGASFKYHDTRMSQIEMLLAKGDRRVADAVAWAAANGRGFDSWREHFDRENWMRAFAAAGLPMVDLYAGDEGVALPWMLIGPGKSHGVRADEMPSEGSVAPPTGTGTETPGSV